MCHRLVMNRNDQHPWEKIEIVLRCWRQKMLIGEFCQPGVAGRGRPSWDGGGRRTVKDAGRKLFFRYVRFKDGGGPRTDKISSKEDGGGRRTNPFRPPQGRIRTEDPSKFLKSGRRNLFRPPQGRIWTKDGQKIERTRTQMFSFFVLLKLKQKNLYE